MNRLPLLIAFLAALSLISPAAGQVRKGRNRDAPPADDGKAPQATPVKQIKVAKDFRVELLYSVPKATQGSWVASVALRLKPARVAE